MADRRPCKRDDPDDHRRHVISKSFAAGHTNPAQIGHSD